MIRVAAEFIQKWQATQVEGGEIPRSICDGLKRDFGSSLPFFTDPSVYVRFPFKRMGEAQINIANLTPAKGEAWVLFCYATSTHSRTSPLRTDGFMIPFEWRRNTEHSKLIPSSMRRQADEVLAFYAIHGMLGVHEQNRGRRDGVGLNFAPARGASDASETGTWGLHPSFCRFGDKIDFSDESLFGGEVGSAWGALVVGLESACRGIVPVNWPFCSLQFNREAGRAMSVEGIERKLAVAASYACREFVVAPEQLAEAQNVLGVLRSKGVPGCDLISIIPAAPGFRSLVGSILYSRFDWLRPSASPKALQNNVFMGRGWLVAQVADGVRNAGMTVVQGSPGTGKTALLSHVAETWEGQFLVDYACSQRPAFDFVKSIAYQVASAFPESYCGSDMEHLRALSEKEMSWDNLRIFYQAAVLGPLGKCSKTMEFSEVRGQDTGGCSEGSMESRGCADVVPSLIVVDALDEALDWDVAKLLGDPELRLPDWVRVVVSTRPIGEVVQLLNRVPVRIVDLDSKENEGRCTADLSSYIQFRLDAMLAGKAPQGCLINPDSADARNLLQVLERRCTNYRYAYNTFLNIDNGTYAMETLDRQLPAGVQGHYLAFCDSHVSQCWDEVKPLLEILVASPGALDKAFVDEVLGTDCSSAVSKMNGYVIDQNHLLFLCDPVFREWLLDSEKNHAFAADPAKGHHRLADVGWRYLTSALNKYGESELTGGDMANLRHNLPEALRDTIGHHVAVAKYLDRCDRFEHAPVLLAMVNSSEDSIVLANAIRRRSKKKASIWLKGAAAILALMATVAFAFSISYARNGGSRRAGDPPDRSTETLDTVAVELLTQIKRLDQHLLVLSSAWNETQKDKFLRIWDGRDGSPNQSLSRKKANSAIMIDGLLELLSTAFETDKLAGEISPVLSSVIGTNAELRARLDGISSDTRAQMDREQALKDRLNALKDRGTVEAFICQLEVVNHAVQSVKLWAEMLYLQQLRLLDTVVQTPSQRGNVNAMLSVLHELSPRALIPDDVNLGRQKELLNEIKHLHVEKVQDRAELSASLSDRKIELVGLYDQIREQCVLSPTENHQDMWLKITRLLEAGLYDDADMALGLYLDYNRESVPHVEAVAKAAKAYLQEAKKSGLKNGVMVHGFENSATHSCLMPGDIVTHVNGQAVRDSAAFVTILEKAGKENKNCTFLRLNEEGRLAQHEGRLLLSDPRVWFSDMTRRTES